MFEKVEKGEKLLGTPACNLNNKAKAEGHDGCVLHEQALIQLIAISVAHSHCFVNLTMKLFSNKLFVHELCGTVGTEMTLL